MRTAWLSISRPSARQLCCHLLRDWLPKTGEEREKERVLALSHLHGLINDRREGEDAQQRRLKELKREEVGKSRFPRKRKVVVPGE